MSRFALTLLLPTTCVVAPLGPRDGTPPDPAIEGCPLVSACNVTGCGSGYPTCVAGQRWGMLDPIPDPAPPMTFDTPGCAAHQPNGPARLALIHVPKASGTSLERLMLNAPINFTLVHDEYDFDATLFDLFIITTRDPSSRLISAFNYNDPFNATTGGCLSEQEVNGLIQEKAGGSEVCGERATRLYRECFALASGAEPEPPTLGAADAFALSLSRGNTTACGALANECVHDPDVYCGANRHLNRATDWYVTGLHNGSASILDRVRAGRAGAFLVRTETFEEDATALWDWLCVPAAARPDASERGDPSEGVPMVDERHHDTALSERAVESLANATAGEQAVIDELEKLAVNGYSHAQKPHEWKKTKQHKLHAQ